MNIKEVIVAKKYAQAFLNLFDEYIHISDYENIKKAELLFRKYHDFLFLLRMPSIAMTTKKKLLDQIFKECLLPSIIIKLSDLLISHQRIFLLPEVFHQMVLVYQKKHHIIEFNIKSSHSLSTEILSTIQQFLAQLTKNNIHYTYKVDAQLIAGLRLQSSTLLWEYSMRKQLQQFRTFLEH